MNKRPALSARALPSHPAQRVPDPMNKTLLFLSGVLATAFLQSPLNAAEAPLSGTIESVAPGVWRLQFGVPDQITPSKLSPRSPRVEGFKQLPGVSSPPLELQKIRCRITENRVVLEIPVLDREESFYGFGLDPVSFRQNNLKKRPKICTDTDAPENAKDGPGSSHAPVPGYFSTAGYGVLVDTARVAEFHVTRLTKASDLIQGAASAASAASEGAALTLDALYNRETAGSEVFVDVPGARGIEIFIFGGPNLVTAVQRYNLYSGGGAVPPLWGLGVKYRTFVDGDEKLVSAVRDGLRTNGIPCDMLGLEPGWQTRAYPCSYVWNKSRFQDPRRFTEETRNMGFKLNLWIHPFVHPESPLFGQLAKNSPSVVSMHGLVFDPLYPPAAKAFGDYFGSELVGKGIDGFKIDECDQPPTRHTNPFAFPNLTEFPSGADGEQMSQMFGSLLQKNLEALFRGQNRRTFSDVRASGPFMASMPFALYSDTEDLRDYLRQVCNASFSGVLWSPETRNAPTLSKLQRRLAVSAFANQCLWNPWFNRLPLWENYTVGYGNWGPKPLAPEQQQAAIKSLRYFGELRMSFIPYLYSAYRNYRETGLPPVRALVLDFPADKAVHTIDDQFLFGDSILVAPYLFEHESFRKVYLPAGTDWRDYWTGDLYKGGQTIISKMVAVDGVERPALYVRNQSIVPVARPVHFVSKDSVFEIECRVYGDKPASFTLFEDDGVSFDFENGAENRVTLSLANGGTVKTSLAGNYKGRRHQISNQAQLFVSQKYVSRTYEPCDAAGLSGLPQLNLSERATYTQSSSLAEAVTGNLFDADNAPGTHAFSTQKEKNAHIVIDLGREQTIAGVSIANRTDQGRFILERAATLAMWSSMDGKSWDSVWQAEEAQPVWNFVFKQPIRARYLKIGLQGENFLHLRRVKLYGPSR
jgi:alpha-D-xyloside xylohydrolase